LRVILQNSHDRQCGTSVRTRGTTPGLH
jgi:hypothetical protein